MLDWMEAPFPLPLSSYPETPPGAGLLEILRSRAEADPFNLVATLIFGMAILHTFAAKRVTVIAHHVQEAHEKREREQGLRPPPASRRSFCTSSERSRSSSACGWWCLEGRLVWARGYDTVKHYFNGSVNFTEPLFVFVIMALASTQPVLDLAEGVLRRIAAIGNGPPTAWWLTILTVAPLMGSFVTEPAAMTIAALLLSKQVFALGPSLRLCYATLGLLFVNISVGGTLTHFAAPPVLMVARPWNWDFGFMLSNFGYKAFAGILVANLAYLLIFRKDLKALPPPERVVSQAQRAMDRGRGARGLHGLDRGERPLPGALHRRLPVLPRLRQGHAAHQSAIDLRPPLLVGFFLGGLVVHGGLQGWWIEPVLASLPGRLSSSGALVLTAFNDNALITYLATLVPDLGEARSTRWLRGR